MFVSSPTSNRLASLPAYLCSLLLISLLASFSAAQDSPAQQPGAAAANAAQQTQQGHAQPSEPQQPTPTPMELEKQTSTLSALPQAPAPQHNSAAHPYSEQDYTRGRWQWPNPFIIYAPRNVAPLRAQNSAQVDQILRDGKMYLSMDDAVTLALENNLDIGIQRYNLSIADTDVLRTSSGAVALGVNAGLLQGTPGGTTGTTAAGGTGPRVRVQPAPASAAPRSVLAAPAQALRAWLLQPRAKARRSIATILSSPARFRLDTRLRRSPTQYSPEPTSYTKTRPPRISTTRRDFRREHC